MIIRRVVMVVAVIAATITMTGCWGANDPRAAVLRAAQEARDAGSEENAVALDDGELTEDEFYAAAYRFQACFRAEGLVMGGPYMSPVDHQRLEWEFPPEIPDGKELWERLDRCEAQWEPVALAFEQTREPVMDEALRVAVLECLAEEGYVLENDASSFGEMVGDPERDGGVQREAASLCVSEHARKIFPELPAVTVAY